MITDFSAIECYRRQIPGYPHVEKGSPYGAFLLPSWGGWHLFVVATPGMVLVPWEHVSVHAVQRRGKKTVERTPTWDEMCEVKNTFWGEDETIVQYHPARADYVNQHKHCLHLWKPLHLELPTPPAYLVGLKVEGETEDVG